MESRVQSQAQRMLGGWVPFIDVQNESTELTTAARLIGNMIRVYACGQRVSLWDDGTALELEGSDGHPS